MALDTKNYPSTFKHKMRPAVLRCRVKAFVVSFVFAALAGATLAATGLPAKKLVMLVADSECGAESTLPKFAAEYLSESFYIVTSVQRSEVHVENNVFNPLREIASADVLLLNAGRPLPEGQMLAVRRHVAAGKAVVAIRTTSISFVPSQEKIASGVKSEWPEWDVDVIGCRYSGRYSHDIHTTVIAAVPPHPISGPLNLPYLFKHALDKNDLLSPNAKPVLIGTIPGGLSKVVAWAFLRQDSGRTFYTSLGFPEDFTNLGFSEFLRNGVLWAADLAYSVRVSIPTPEINIGPVTIPAKEFPVNRIRD